MHCSPGHRRMAAVERCPHCNQCLAAHLVLVDETVFVCDLCLHEVWPAVRPGRPRALRAVLNVWIRGY